MAWPYLIIAGLFEVGWAIGLKYTDGFTRLWPSVLTLTAMGASLFFLAKALKAIPVGIGYAVWTGIGAVGTAALGIVLFAESAHPSRLLSIAVIVAGIIGLKLTSGAETS
jgi:quaternary ammonium compound-resistance protein SugE